MRNNHQMDSGGGNVFFPAARKCVRYYQELWDWIASHIDVLLNSIPTMFVDVYAIKKPE